MKTKIAAALKTKYKRFGLSNEAFDRIASAKEKTVTTEDAIEEGISDTQTMELIANELQKMRDKEIQSRTDLQSSFDDYKTKHPETKPTEDDGEEQEPKLDWKATLAATLKEHLEPLQQEIATLKSQSSKKAALEGARETFFGNDYAKKYKDEANDAWERAVELNEATGNKMTAEQLNEKAAGYFNKAVSRRGVDTSKPFVADTSEADEKGTTDWSAEKKRQQDAGRLPK